MAAVREALYDKEGEEAQAGKSCYMKKKEKEDSLFSERGLCRTMAKVSAVLAAGVIEPEKRATLFRKIAVAAWELIRPSTWELPLGERLDHECRMCGSKTMWKFVCEEGDPED